MYPVFRKSVYMTAFLVMAFGHTASAERPLLPEAKSLEEMDARLQQEKEQREALRKEFETVDKDLQSTKDKLVQTARFIQANEKSLRDLEQRIKDLEIKKSELEGKLKTDRLSISRLVLALERIRRTPPEAMIARPESPYKTAQSALLMGNILPALNRHAKALSKNLETLNSVTKDLKEEHQSAQDITLSLKEEHEKLSSLMLHRKSLFEDINKDIKVREATIQKISFQAKNLEDLVKKLKEDEERERERQETLKIASLVKPKPEFDAPPDKGSGGAQLPVSGIIRTKYEEKDDLGATSNGLSIEASSGALVVAPIAGKVQFAGAFKRYGNIVILEHAEGFHSLVAGLEKIDTVVGQHVAMGEPIGKLPDSNLVARPKLYYELRKNGKPVNPSLKFSDLGS